MNKVRIIDLLNKIANSEEVPKIILFSSYKYKFDKIKNEYQRLNYDGTLGATLGTINVLDLCLNDEVEIIEEDKKIEKLNQDNFQCVSNLEASGQSANYFEYGIEDEIRDIVDKINEIIDHINKGE